MDETGSLILMSPFVLTSEMSDYPFRRSVRHFHLTRIHWNSSWTESEPIPLPPLPDFLLLLNRFHHEIPSPWGHFLSSVSGLCFTPRKELKDNITPEQTVSSDPDRSENSSRLPLQGQLSVLDLGNPVSHQFSKQNQIHWGPFPVYTPKERVGHPIGS